MKEPDNSVRGKIKACLQGAATLLDLRGNGTVEDVPLGTLSADLQALRDDFKPYKIDLQTGNANENHPI